MRRTADDLSRGTNIDDLERPRNPKIGGISKLFAILGCDARLKSKFSPVLKSYFDMYPSQWRLFLLNSGGRHGERGVRAYNGGLGAEPPAGSRAQGVRGSKPPEAERKFNFDNIITRLIFHQSKHFGVS